ncbi:MAG: Crp/Fnr family transcriptional regulator [Chloroflexi bacterium]|nr:Crp/Fnr family transcriptional regulator [Chloroflexota bacterium]MCI0643619.1 Crp/Fnr family transcriptional regulator [Chloroflexota bacterium]
MIEIFRDLSRRELKAMDHQFTMTACKAGKIFYMPEDSGEVLFLLKKGRVQLYRLSLEGKKIVVAFLGPGAIFGEMSLVGQGMYSTYAEAVEECILCVMSRPDVERLMREKPEVALRIVETLAKRLVYMERQLEEVAFKSIPARLASVLLRLAGEAGSSEVIGFTHQDLAELLGTYRETITQTLNDFRAIGLVQLERKKVILTDLAGLENVAEN